MILTHWYHILISPQSTYSHTKPLFGKSTKSVISGLGFKCNEYIKQHIIIFISYQIFILHRIFFTYRNALMYIPWYSFIFSLLTRITLFDL